MNHRNVAALSLLLSAAGLLSPPAASGASTILTIVATSVPGLEVLAIFGLLLILPSFAFGILYLLAMTETIAAVAAFNQVPAQPNKTLSILFGIIAVLFGIFGAWLGAVYFQHHIRTIEMHCSAAHP